MIYALPQISVCVPIHDMPNGDFFLSRLVNSLMGQTFRDFEVIFTKEGKMAPNTNAAIKKARGRIVKVLYMDDYLTHENSLKDIADNFKGGWLVTGCVHDMGNGVMISPHIPTFTPDDLDNFIGSPSVLAFENDNPLLFDEEMTWLLDHDLYKRLYKRYGMPTVLNDPNVTIGIGAHQVTHILSNEVKLKERDYLNKKHA